MATEYATEQTFVNVTPVGRMRPLIATAVICVVESLLLMVLYAMGMVLAPVRTPAFAKADTRQTLISVTSGHVTVC